jgi:hypothetical protein
MEIPLQKLASTGLLFFGVLLGFVHAQPESHPNIQLPKFSGPKPWTPKAINDKPGQFQFAIVSDRTGGHRPGIFEDGVRKLNLLQPEFVMSVGDLIEGYTTDTVEIHRQWDEFIGFVNQLDMPFFFVPGNHDLTNAVQERIWERRIGPKHYAFVYKDVLFIAMNSEDQTRGAGRGSISDSQYEWIKKTLEAHPDVRWTMLFMHQPLWVQQTDPVRWFDVEKLLASRRHTVFVGHRHHYVKYERNNTNYYMLATTGGSSSLRGPQFGEFDHFTWITMTDRGPILANLHLDGVFDEQVHTEQVGAFTSKLLASQAVRPDALYADGAFKKDSVRFRITNTYDVPMTVRFSSGFSWDLKTDFPRPERVVPPNSVAFVSMGVEAKKGKPAEQIRSLPVKAEVSVKDQPGKTEFFVPFAFHVAPVKRHALQKRKAAVTVDGNLNEWELPFSVASADGASFNIQYDAENVYLAVQVNDADIQNKADVPTFSQDFVGFVMDGQPQAQSACETGEGWFKKSLYFIVSPEDESGKNSVWDLEEAEKSIVWKCVRNAKGYALEVAAPADYFRKLQGEWRTLRLNIVIQDKDGNGKPQRYFWQPNWRDANTVTGSGMFFRK